MANFINYIEIMNFKSLRNCGIGNCKRINLFIGRPNVGKSNILEALSLFSIPYLRESSMKKLSSLIRLEHESELFYNGNIGAEARINTNIGSCSLHYDPKEELEIYLTDQDNETYLAKIDSRLNTIRALTTKNNFDIPVKRYNFKQDVVYKKGHSKYLIPPYGSNLLSIIENYPDLKQEVIRLFADYKLEIAFDKGSQSIKIIQQNQDGIFLIPYNSIADTLQRIIFYKAAIASNTGSILLFEEPEAHSFPPYMTHLTQEMINKKDNQYFVATHSPFILNDLLENGLDELAVFVVNYKNQQTQLNQLDREELHRIFQNGVDLFTNSESFI